jgi:hypothetical protein
MYTLITVGNKHYTEEALIEAIESAEVRLSAINRKNPLTFAEYDQAQSDYKTLVNAASQAGLIVSIETRGSHNSH